MSRPIVMECGVKYRDVGKTALISVKNVATEREVLLRKPEWVKIKLPADPIRIRGIKATIRKNDLHSIYEEAPCPSLAECFNRGTATFMILGAIYTHHYPFCSVARSRPVAPDANRPVKLAQTITDMVLRYVVITSVGHDDLRDDGVQHFADCITAIREKSPQIKIEALVPDFRGRMDHALDILTVAPPDVFNHNLGDVPHIYRQVWPGADYNRSLKLLERFKRTRPEIPTKSGLMMGLGETNEKTIEIMHDLRHRSVTMLTLGQYLQSGRHHPSVQRYVNSDEFDEMRAEAPTMGFVHAARGPFVRSSYHADLQARRMEVK